MNPGITKLFLKSIVSNVELGRLKSFILPSSITTSQFSIFPLDSIVHTIAFLITIFSLIIFNFEPYSTKGKIISPVVMGFVYFLFVTPIAIIIRLFGKDLLSIKFSKMPSYWIKRQKNIGSMKKQF